jgi:hypothetical protein
MLIFFVMKHKKVNGFFVMRYTTDGIVRIRMRPMRPESRQPINSFSCATVNNETSNIKKNQFFGVIKN